MERKVGLLELSKDKERTGCLGKRFHGGRDEGLVKIEMGIGRPFQGEGTGKNVF